MKRVVPAIVEHPALDAVRDGVMRGLADTDDLVIVANARFADGAGPASGTGGGTALDMQRPACQRIVDQGQDTIRLRRGSRCP